MWQPTTVTAPTERLPGRLEAAFPDYALPVPLLRIAKAIEEADSDDLFGINRHAVAEEVGTSEQAVGYVNGLLSDPDEKQLRYVCRIYGWDLAEVDETSPETAIAATDSAPRVEVPAEPLEEWRRPKTENEYKVALHRDPRVSHMAFLAGLAIGFHCQATMQLFAGNDQIAEWMHLAPSGRKRVPNYLGELVELGYLEVTGKHRRTYRYRLTMP